MKKVWAIRGKPCYLYKKGKKFIIVTANNNINIGAYLMDPKNYESEINIKDLVLVVLKKLVIMIIAGAILGGALFSYKVIKRVKTNDILDVSVKLSESETDVQYELRVQNINRARVYVEMISNLSKQIDHQRTYIGESLYMQIDAENVYQSTAQITLTLENSDVNGVDSALFGAYDRDIKAGNYLDEYAKQIGTKPDYIKELISFSSTAANNTIINVDSDVDRVGSMYINIYGPSREFCDDVMNLVINEINTVYDVLNGSVAKHTISLVGVQQFQKIDNNIRDGQISHTNTINTLQNQIASYNDQLDKVAKELGVSSKEEILSYFETHEEVKVDADNLPSGTSERYISRWTMIRPGIKFGAVGFVGGAFLVAAFIVLNYIFSRRIKSQAQFFGLFSSVKNIGVMKPLGKRSKYTTFIEVKSEDDSKQSSENVKKLISANYTNLTKDCPKVLITGTGDKKAMEEAYKALKIKGDFKPDMFNNPEVLAAVPNYDGIVLLEQRKVSLIKNVRNEISLISNAGTPIIGAIII